MKLSLSRKMYISPGLWPRPAWKVFVPVLVSFFVLFFYQLDTDLDTPGKRNCLHQIGQCARGGGGEVAYFLVN